MDLLFPIISILVTVPSVDDIDIVACQDEWHPLPLYFECCGRLEMSQNMAKINVEKLKHRTCENSHIVIHKILYTNSVLKLPENHEGAKKKKKKLLVT